MLVSVFATDLRAHELQPTIADLEVGNGTATLTFRINLDAILADIDLDAIEDTDDAANAETYDALRARPADEIADLTSPLLERWNALPMLRADGEPVTLETVTLQIPQDIDPDLARVAEWVLSGGVPSSARQVALSWPSGAGPLVFRQQGVDDPYTGYINGGDTSPGISIAGGKSDSGWATFASYVPVGFENVLPKGLDHILFVLGLFFLTTQLGPLLWQVATFTLAHSVTLALGALGLLDIPGSILEPLIAASIVYVAVENIYSAGLSRWRPLIVFGFGLLHGLDFASALSEFGLPEGQFLPALIGFNIGVELGQLAVIAIASGLIWVAVLVSRMGQPEGEGTTLQSYPAMFRAVSNAGSLVIALIGIWWLIARVFL